eukprot:363990-Chlamydomonas_euryale.AAC.8
MRRLCEDQFSYRGPVSAARRMRLPLVAGAVTTAAGRSQVPCSLARAFEAPANLSVDAWRLCRHGSRRRLWRAATAAFVLASAFGLVTAAALALAAGLALAVAAAGAALATAAAPRPLCRLRAHSGDPALTRRRA